MSEVEGLEEVQLVVDSFERDYGGGSFLSLCDHPNFFYLPSKYPSEVTISIILSSLSPSFPTLVILNPRWCSTEIEAAIKSMPHTPTPTIYYETTYPPSSSASSNLNYVNINTLPPFSPSSSFLSSLRNLAASIFHNPPPPSLTLSPPRIILFTSGTTGKPKGVQLSLRSLLFQSYAKTRPPVSFSPSTALYLNMPLCHVGGLISMLAIILCSASYKLPAPLPSTIPTAVNALAMVPSMLNQFPSFTSPNSTITLLLVGGSSLTPQSAKRAKTLFPNARIVQTYACTEAASSITFLPLPIPPNAPPNSIGKPYSRHIEVGIFSPDGSPLPAGKMGVIGTRGPHVMDGYVGFKPHRETEFLMTSDLGYFHVPSSTFCFVGRASDTVRSGGETVVCAEVEREVMRLDLGLQECASFGLDDSEGSKGELVCVAVVPSAGTVHSSVSVEENLRVKWGLAKYKRPRRVFIMDALPRNSNGKVVKDALRLRFQQKSRL